MSSSARTSNQPATLTALGQLILPTSPPAAALMHWSRKLTTNLHVKIGRRTRYDRQRQTADDSLESVKSTVDSAINSASASRWSLPIIQTTNHVQLPKRQRRALQTLQKTVLRVIMDRLSPTVPRKRTPMGSRHNSKCDHSTRWGWLHYALVNMRRTKKTKSSATACDGRAMLHKTNFRF